MSITTNLCCDETEPRSIHSPDICMDMGVCMAESETITTLLISYTPVQNKKVKKREKRRIRHTKVPNSNHDNDHKQQQNPKQTNHQTTKQ